MNSFEMAVQLSSVRRGLGRHIVVLKVHDHHLPQREVIINNDDMADIYEHELISQIFSTHGLLDLAGPGRRGAACRAWAIEQPASGQPRLSNNFSSVGSWSRLSARYCGAQDGLYVR